MKHTTIYRTLTSLIIHLLSHLLQYYKWDPPPIRSSYSIITTLEDSLAINNNTLFTIINSTLYSDLILKLSLLFVDKSLLSTTTTGSLIWPTSDSLLRESHEPSVNPSHHLETRPPGINHERFSDFKEELMTASLFVYYIMESDQPPPSLPPPTSSGVSDLSNNDHTQLAQRVVVFYALDNDHATFTDTTRITRGTFSSKTIQNGSFWGGTL